MIAPNKPATFQHASINPENADESKFTFGIRNDTAKINAAITANTPAAIAKNLEAFFTSEIAKGFDSFCIATNANAIADIITAALVSVTKILPIYDISIDFASKI